MCSSSEPLDILIAEDNDITRACMERILSSMGHSVKCVRDGAELVDHMALNYGVSNQNLPIILTDYNMPKMNGLQAASKVRQMHRDLKIVMITSEASTLTEDSVDEFVDVIIPKPVSRDVLTDALLLVRTPNSHSV
ncbi:chemotaxis protein CheY [Acrasis kona]|uniref:Chemotaxis protein CheY n=1 Tax=Acrasis kona TaxID=1008807 RepID=A0AAW2YLW7_9EUKA